jgi:hypothetical protein
MGFMDIFRPEQIGERSLREEIDDLRGIIHNLSDAVSKMIDMSLSNEACCRTQQDRLDLLEAQVREIMAPAKEGDGEKIDARG